MDLLDASSFRVLEIPMLSIAFDSAAEQAPAADALGIDPGMLLIDADGSVSEAYGVLRWAVATGEPGHTFVLVGAEGDILWLQDYGAQENGGRMYVPVDELVGEIGARLR